MPTRVSRFLEAVQIISLLYGFVSGVTFAYFKKSWTYVDVCDVGLPAHRTLTSISVHKCAESCSHDADCRRFLFCSSTSSCKLFMDNDGCQITEGILGCSCFVKKHGCIDESCTCQLGYYGDECQHVIEDCSDAESHGVLYNKPVVLYVKPPGATEPFNMLCYPLNGGWGYLFYRKSQCKAENFNRSLAEYEAGFGTYAHNNWLGFDKIVPLLSMPNAQYYFNLLMVKTDGSYCQSSYNGIEVNTTGSLYTLQLGQHVADNPPCGDSLTGSLSLNGKPFSTADRDLTGSNKCASTLGGGWWFQSDVDGSECSRSFLTGTMNDIFWKDDLGTARFTEIYCRIYRRP